MKIAFYDTKPYDKESFDKYKEKTSFSPEINSVFDMEEK